MLPKVSGMPARAVLTEGHISDLHTMVISTLDTGRQDPLSGQEQAVLGLQCLHVNPQNTDDQMCYLQVPG